MDHHISNLIYNTAEQEARAKLKTKFGFYGYLPDLKGGRTIRTTPLRELMKHKRSPKLEGYVQNEIKRLVKMFYCRYAGKIRSKLNKDKRKREGSKTETTSKPIKATAKSYGTTYGLRAVIDHSDNSVPWGQ